MKEHHHHHHHRHYSYHQQTTTPLHSTILAEPSQQRRLEFQSRLPDTTTTTTTVFASTHADRLTVAEQLLTHVGDMLADLEAHLTRLQGGTTPGRNDDSQGVRLGDALVRTCHELAAAAGHVAHELHPIHPSRDAADMARLRAFQGDSLVLTTTTTDEGGPATTRTEPPNNHQRLVEYDTDTLVHDHDTKAYGYAGRSGGSGGVVPYQPDHAANNTNYNHSTEVLTQYALAADLLRDIQTALSAVTAEEAHELCDLALWLLQSGVQTLRQLHAQCTPESLLSSVDHHNATTAATRHGQRSLSTEHPNRHILPGHDPDDTPTPRAPPHQSTAMTRTASPPHSTTSTSSTTPPARIRCLWPPLLPVAQHTLQSTRHHLSTAPVWTTALAAVTVGPALATLTVWMALPTLVADRILQSLYNHQHDSHLIVAAETAAARTWASLRLTYLTTRAVARPLQIVARRQVRHHGPTMVRAVQSRIQHPVATVHEVGQWVGEGVGWVVEQVTVEQEWWPQWWWWSGKDGPYPCTNHSHHTRQDPHHSVCQPDMDDSASQLSLAERLQL